MPEIGKDCYDGKDAFALNFNLLLLFLDSFRLFNPFICFKPNQIFQRKRGKRGKIASFPADMNQTPVFTSAVSEFFSAFSFSVFFA